MKSMIAFMENLTLGKKLFLLIAPFISIIISMKAAILGLWALILIDLITGIRKNLIGRNVIGKNQPISIFRASFYRAIRSYMLRQTWKKFYEYSMGILTVVVFESLIFGVTPIEMMGKVFTISELAVVYPAGVEVWSIFENMEGVTGRNILEKLKQVLPPQLRIIFSSAKKKDEENKRQGL